MNKQEEELFDFLKNEKFQDFTCFRTLINRCQNVNIEDKFKNTPIFYVNNNIAILNFLFERKANLEHKNLMGETPIFHSLKLNKKDNFYFLLKKKANLNVINSLGENLLFYAQNLDRATTNLLIKKGLNVNQRNLEGETPIFYAVKSNCNDAFINLAENKADLNAKNCFGRTPIYTAIENDSVSMIHWLSSYNGNFLVQDDSGMTPLEYAGRLDKQKSIKAISDTLKIKTIGFKKHNNISTDKAKDKGLEQ